jgi:hypothetical protein
MKPSYAMNPRGKCAFTFAISTAILTTASLLVAEGQPATLAGSNGPPQSLATPSPTSCTCDCLVGYGAPILSVTRLDGSTGLLLGARGGAVLRRRFVLGAAGFSLLNNVTMPASAQLGPGSHNIRFGSGGFWFAYILSPELLVHPTFGVLLGGGSVSYQVTDQAAGAPATYATSSFFLAQPEIEADVNVTRFMRIGVGAYYRFVVGVKLEDKLTNGDVGGPGALLAIKFGSY